jgi:tRNA G18 (ribose-2'-O)-methylase SpoU
MAFEKIISVKNEGIKNVLALRERKARDAAGLTVIDGLREVEAALQAGVTIEKVYLCPELLERKDVAVVSARLSKRRGRSLRRSLSANVWKGLLRSPVSLIWA